MSRRLVREKVVQSLYELEFQPQQLDEILKKKTSKLEAEDKDFFTKLVRGVLETQPAIDQEIELYLKQGWSLSRISIIERAILRLAGYELQHENTPPKVVVNEAVELAKRFGDDESKRFINGVLGNWINEQQTNQQ